MINVNREMGESVPTEGGVDHKLEEDEIEELHESSCERRKHDQLTELEGKRWRLEAPRGWLLRTILEVATKVDDEDPLDGHIFWQLLMQAGYTRW